MTSVYWPGVDDAPLEDFSFGDPAPMPMPLAPASMPYQGQESYRAMANHSDNIPLPEDDFMPLMNDYADCDALLEQSLSVQDLEIGRAAGGAVPVDDFGMLHPSMIAKYAAFDPHAAAEARHTAQLAAAEAARALQAAEAAQAQADMLEAMTSPPRQFTQAFAPPVYGSVDAYLGVDLSAAQNARLQQTKPVQRQVSGEIYATPARKRVPDTLIDMEPGEWPARQLFAEEPQRVPRPLTPLSCDRSKPDDEAEEVGEKERFSFPPVPQTPRRDRPQLNGLGLGLGLGMSLSQPSIVGACPTTPSRHPPTSRAPVTPYGRTPRLADHASPYGLQSPVMRSPGMRSPVMRSPVMRSPVPRSPIARSPKKLASKRLEWQPILTISKDALVASQEIIKSQAAAAASESKCKRKTNLPPGTVDEYVSGPDADQQWHCLYPHCGRLFKRRYNLRSHIQTHLCDRPYTCEICSATFVRPHDLRRHERCHSNERPFTCPCGKGFTRLDALQRHRYRQICIGGMGEKDDESPQ